MLVLSRKRGQKILIGGRIIVSIGRIGREAVRVGIEAPRDVPIVRAEFGRSQGAGGRGQELEPARAWQP